MAFERSWLRVLEVAKDRRRRGSGSGNGMSAVDLNWGDCGVGCIKNVILGE